MEHEPYHTDIHVEESTNETEKVCRNCHDTTGDDFIVPCKCSGSIKYVHRKCLDKWRIVSPQPQSFSRCDICHENYQFEHVKNNPTAYTTCKFICWSTLDFTLLFIIWQAIVFSLMGIVMLIDLPRGRDQFFPRGWNHFIIDYLSGHAALSFLLGIFGIIMVLVLLCQMCFGASVKSTDYTAHTYPYYRYNPTYDFFWYWYFPMWFSYPHPGGMFCCYYPSWVYGPCLIGPQNCTDCPGLIGGGGGSGDGDNPFGIVIVVIVVILIVIGLFVGAVLFLVIAYNIIEKRKKLLYASDKVKESRVLCLESAGLLK